MIQQIFEELFGSKTRVKILKFLFRNEGGFFDALTISNRIQEKKSLVKRELNKLLRIGLIQKKYKLPIK